jgi:hypothetical protein
MPATKIRKKNKLGKIVWGGFVKRTSPHCFFMTTPPPTSLKRNLLAVLLLALVIAGLVFAVHRLLAGNTLGIDLFVFWSSGRAMLIEGSSPYDPAVNQQVQMAIFGRLAEAGEDPMLYAFPPYGLLPVTPLLALPFDWAQAAWFVFYLLAACSLPYLLFPHAPRWLTLTLPVLYPVTFALILGNYVFLIGLILLFTCALVVLPPEPARKWQILAGILLAWTTIKPQFVWLYLAFLALYTLRTRRWAFSASFGLTFSGLLLFSWLAIPTWVTDWLQQVRNYAQMNQVESNAHSLLRLILPQAWLQTGSLLALLLFLLATAWIFKTWWQGDLSDLHSLAWVGLVTNLFDPRAISYEQITLVVPFFLWAALSRSRPAALLWLAAIVLSWGLFSIAATGVYPLATEQGPVLLYGLWLAWFFRQRKAGLFSTRPQPAGA